MSERGQKIFKWIVWIAICFFATISIARIVYYANHPLISENQWIEMVSDSFEIEDTEYINLGSDEYVTGKYAALTIMKAMGNSNIKFMTGESDLDDDQLVDLAVEKEIVSEGQLKDSLTESEAQDIIANAMDFYFDMDNYPEYFEVDYVCDVVDTDNWTISNFDEENNILYVSSLNDVPTEGQVILARNEFGIAKPRYVKECKETEDGQYEIILEQMSDPSKLFNNISFSGKADFSYMLNASEGSGADTEDTVDVEKEDSKNSSIFDLFEPMIVNAANNKTYVTTADIETGGTITAEAESSGSYSYSYNSYLKIENDEKASKYSITLDDNGNIKSTPVSNDITLQAEHEANKITEDDKFIVEGSASDSFTYKVKLIDLQLAASYCASGSKHDKFLDVRVTSDIELDWSIKGKFEGKIPIAEVEVPLSCGGVVSVNLRLYLVIDASGEVTLTYEMHDVTLGVRVAEDGFSAPHSRNKEADSLDVTAKVSVGVGFCGEVAITIGDWSDFFEYDIIDPGVEVKFEASAETLKNNEGFEDYPQCVQISMAAPTVTFMASVGEDSLLYALLDLFNLTAKTSYEFITSNNAPFKKEYHIETELEGTTNTIEGSKDYCTHVMLEEGKELIVDPLEAAKQRAEEASRKKAEEARKKAQEEFEKAIEDAIGRWLVENCGGC